MNALPERGRAAGGREGPGAAGLGAPGFVPRPETLGEEGAPATTAWGQGDGGQGFWGTGSLRFPSGSFLLAEG